MDKEHTCMCCGVRSVNVEHVEYGLYQCSDIQQCMENDMAKNQTKN